MSTRSVRLAGSSLILGHCNSFILTAPLLHRGGTCQQQAYNKPNIYKVFSRTAARVIILKLGFTVLSKMVLNS